MQLFVNQSYPTLYKTMCRISISIISFTFIHCYKFDLRTFWYTYNLGCVRFGMHMFWVAYVLKGCERFGLRTFSLQTIKSDLEIS